MGKIFSSKHTIPVAILGLIVFGLTAATALVIDWFPDSAAAEVGRQDNLMSFMFWSSAVFFTIVTTFLVYSVWRFRAKPDDDSDGPPTHGNTLLEIVWTLVPALLLLFVTVYSYVVLDRNEALASDRMVVDVTAQQFNWNFGYPDANVRSGDLRVPVGRQVEFRLRATDVIHDLYVVEWRLKQDATPGITTRLLVTPNEVGTFQLICAELCGAGHSAMRARAIVMPQAEFDAWLANAQQQVRDTANSDNP